MNSLKQFLSLAVQNAEETPELGYAVMAALMTACVVFILVAMGVMCWLRFRYQKKRNPNLTAGQFWRDLFMTDGPGS